MFRFRSRVVFLCVAVPKIHKFLCFELENQPLDAEISQIKSFQSEQKKWAISNVIKKSGFQWSIDSMFRFRSRVVFLCVAVL